MTNLEYNSIRREAIKLAKQLHPKMNLHNLLAMSCRDIAKPSSKDLKSARKDFRGLIGDVSDIEAILALVATLKHSTFLENLIQYRTSAL